MSGNFHNLMPNKHAQITKQKMLQNTWKDAVYKVEVVQMSWEDQWGIGKDCSTNLTPFTAAEAFCLVKDICQNTGRPKPKFPDKEVEKGRTRREGSSLSQSSTSHALCKAMHGRVELTLPTLTKFESLSLLVCMSHDHLYLTWTL